jgi:ribosomal protein L31E
MSRAKQVVASIKESVMRRMQIAGSVVLMLAIAGPACAQGLDPVKVSVAAKKSASGMDITVTLTIEKNWHIYANPVGLDDLKPAETMIKITGKGQVNAEVKYPPPTQVIDDKIVGKYRVYEGRIEIPVTVQGSGPIEVGVRYQPCDDKRCLPTKTFTQTVP